MRCELCNKIIQQYETAHGLKYGLVDVVQDIFLPAKDSAWTVICSTCGDQFFKMIYSNLKTINQSIYKTFMQTK
jgi:hypothetical protein